MQKPKFTKYILLAFVAVTVCSCINYEKSETVKFAGSITNETRNITQKFDKIKISDGVTLILEQSNNTKITVISNKGFNKEIKTEVKNGTLYISSGNYKTSFSILGYKHNTIREAETKKVFIKLPLINELEASSASRIESKGTLKGGIISLKSSSASKIKLNLEYEKIDAESSSASKIELKGMALDCTAKASSGSKIDAKDLLVNAINAESSSGSKISTQPIISLIASASSGGKIEYKNIPKHIEKTMSSGGSIEQN